MVDACAFLHNAYDDSNLDVWPYSFNQTGISCTCVKLTLFSRETSMPYMMLSNIFMLFIFLPGNQTLLHEIIDSAVLLSMRGQLVAPPAWEIQKCHGRLSARSTRHISRRTQHRRRRKERSCREKLTLGITLGTHTHHPSKSPPASQRFA